MRMRTKLIRAVVFAVLATSSLVVAQSPSSPATTTVIRAGTLIDPVSGEAKHDQIIVIRGNRVAAVGECQLHADSRRRQGHRPLQRHGSARDDRVAHPHLPAG